MSKALKTSLDVRMPGMNGLELQRLLADSGDAMPIIFISAHEDTRVSEKAMANWRLPFCRNLLRRTLCSIQ
jgi:two-component system response regulator FixJ